MNNNLYSLFLIVYGSFILGSNTEWQIGVASFFIASGVVLAKK